MEPILLVQCRQPMIKILFRVATVTALDQFQTNKNVATNTAYLF